MATGAGAQRGDRRREHHGAVEHVDEHGDQQHDDHREEQPVEHEVDERQLEHVEADVDLELGVCTIERLGVAIEQPGLPLG